MNTISTVQLDAILRRLYGVNYLLERAFFGGQDLADCRVQMVVLKPALNPLQDVLNQINLLLRLRQPRFQPTQRHTQTWWEVGRGNIEPNHSHLNKASLGLPGTWISGNHGFDDVIQDPSQTWNIFKVQAQIKKGFANSRVVPELSHACVEDGDWNRSCHGWSRVESTKSYLIDIIVVR